MEIEVVLEAQSLGLSAVFLVREANHLSLKIKALAAFADTPGAGEAG